MAKRATLSDFAATKPGAATTAPASNEAETLPAKKLDTRKGQSLRLSAAAWRQLKMIAMDEGTSVHQILVEAVDEAFRKRGKPTIAMDGQPDRKKL